METFNYIRTKEGYAENCIHMFRDNGQLEEAIELKRLLTLYEEKKYDARYYLADELREEALELWNKVYEYIQSVIQKVA